MVKMDSRFLKQNFQQKNQNYVNIKKYETLSVWKNL